VFVNNRLIEFDHPPVIENNRTLVPMRAIFEALGASVSWDDSTKSVEARRGNLTIRLAVGNAAAERWDESGYSNLTLDAEARIIKDTVFVPLRFIAESLNANVNWDNVTRTAEVTAAQP